MDDVREASVSLSAPSPEYDDEVVFWERFFERLAPFRDSIINTKNLAMKSPLGDLYQIGAKGINNTSDLFSRRAIRTAELSYSMILRSPGLIVAILILISALTIRPAMDFQDQINGDVEIYLPDGADSTELLLDVREAPWATDIFILYIQTDNAATGNERGNENITDVNILSQLSWLEGDDNNRLASGYQDGLDTYKDDRGRDDGIIWILSPSQIIKEANSSSYRFSCAVEKYGLPTGPNDNCAISSSNPNEGYSIPGDQERAVSYTHLTLPTKRIV